MTQRSTRERCPADSNARRPSRAHRPGGIFEMLALTESHLHNLESEYGSDDSGGSGGGAGHLALRTDPDGAASPGFDSMYDGSGGLLSDPLSAPGAQTPLAFAQSPAAHGMFGGSTSTSSSRTRTPELDLGAPAKRGPSTTATGGRSAPMETIPDDPNSPAARQILKTATVGSTPAARQTSSAATAGKAAGSMPARFQPRKPARIENQPSLHAYIEVQAKALERLLGADGGSGSSLVSNDPQVLAKNPAVQQLLAEQAKTLAAQAASDRDAAQASLQSALLASQSQVATLESALAKSEHHVSELQSLVADWEKTVKQMQEDQAALVTEGVRQALEERRLASMAGSALRTPSPSRWRTDLARAQELASSGGRKPGTPGSALRGLGSPRASLEPTPSPEPELPLLPTSSAVAERERLLAQLNEENAALAAQVESLQEELQQMCNRYEAACKELEGQDKTVPDAATATATAPTTIAEVTPPRKKRMDRGRDAAAEGISDSDDDEGEGGSKPDPAVAAQAHQKLLSQSHDLFMLGNQLTDLREQLAQNQRDADAKAKKLADEHHAAMDQVQAQNSYFVRELESAQSSHATEIERMQAEHAREISALHSKIAQGAQTLAQADLKVAEALAQLQRDAQAHENSLAELRLKLRKAEATARESAAQISDAESRATALQEALSDAEGRAAALPDAEARASQLQTALCDAESRASQLQAALDELAERHAALESTHGVAAEDASSLHGLLDRVRAALQQQTFNKSVMARAMQEYERSVMLDEQQQQQVTALASPASQVRRHSSAAAAATRALSNALGGSGSAHSQPQHPSSDHDPDNPFLDEDPDEASGNPFLDGADQDEELRNYLEQLRQVQRQSQMEMGERAALQQRVAALEEELARALQQAADSAAAAAGAAAQQPQQSQPPPSHVRVLSGTGSEIGAARVRSPFDSDDEEEDGHGSAGHRQAPSISSDQKAGAGAGAPTSPSHATTTAETATGTPFDVLLNDTPVASGAADAASGFDSPHVAQKLSSASAENRRLAGQVAALQRQLNDLLRAQQQDQSRAQQAEADARRELQQLKDQLAQSQAACDKAAQDAASLKDQLAASQSDAAQLKDQLAQSQAACEKASYDASQLPQLQHSFEAQQALLQSLHVEAAQLQSELAALHAEHAALQGQLAAATDELAQARQSALMHSLEREQRAQEDRERREQIAREMEELMEALKKQQQQQRQQAQGQEQEAPIAPHSAPLHTTPTDSSASQAQPLLAPHAQRIRDLWAAELARSRAEIDALQRELALAKEREDAAAAAAAAADAEAVAAAERKLAAADGEHHDAAAAAESSADTARALQEAQMDKLVLQSQLLGLSELHQQKESSWVAERKALEASLSDQRAARAKAETMVESLKQDLYAAQLKLALQAERIGLLERDLAAATNSAAPPSPLQARTAQLETQERMASLSAELDKLEGANAELRAKRAEAEEANRELRESKELQAHTIAQLEKDLQAREARCAALEEQLRKFETDLSAAGRRSAGDSRSFDDERSSLLQQIAYLESGLRVQMDIVTELRRKQREQKAAGRDAAAGVGAGVDDTQTPLDETVPASSAAASRPRTPGRTSAAASGRKDRSGAVAGDDIITVTTVSTSTTSSLHITGGGPLSPRHAKSKSTPHSPMAPAGEGASAAGSSSPKSSLLRSGSGTGGGATPLRDREASSLLFVSAQKDAEIATLRARVEALEAELTHLRVKHDSATKAHAAHLDQCGPQIRSLLQQVETCRAQHDLSFVAANSAALEAHPAYTSKLAQREREFSAAIRAELEHHERVRAELDQRHRGESERWRAERAQMEHRHAEKEEEFRRAKAELQAAATAAAATARPSSGHANGSAVHGLGSVRNELHYTSTTNVNARSGIGAGGSTAERSTHTTFTATVTTDGLGQAGRVHGTGAGTGIGPSTPLLPHSQLKGHSLLALRSPAKDSAAPSTSAPPASEDDGEFAAAEMLAGAQAAQAAASAAAAGSATTDAAIAAAIAAASASASASFLPLIRALQGDKSLLEQTILQHVKSLNSVDRRARSVEARNQELEVSLRQAVASLPLSDQRAVLEREMESAPASSLRAARDLRSHDPYSPVVVTPKRAPLSASMLSPSPIGAAPASGPRRTLPLHATPPSVLRGGAGLDSAASTPLQPSPAQHPPASQFQSPSFPSPAAPSAPPSAAAASSTRSRVDVSHTAAQLSYLQQTLLNLQKKQMQRQAQAQTPRASTAAAAATPHAASTMHSSPPAAASASGSSAFDASSPAPRSSLTSHRSDSTSASPAAAAASSSSSVVFGDDPADWSLAPLPSFQLSADAFAAPLATHTEVRSRRVETTTITSMQGIEPPAGAAAAARSRAGSLPRATAAAEQSPQA